MMRKLMLVLTSSLVLFAGAAHAEVVELFAPTTFYVAPNGVNANNACTSEASPCATLQYAYDVVQQNVDLRGQNILFQLAAGTYTSGLQASGALRGQRAPGSVTIRGNILTPNSVVIRPTGTFPSFTAAYGAAYQIEGVKMDHSNTAQDTIQVGQYSTIGIAFVEFGHNFNPYNHLTVAFMANLYVYGDYVISGGGQTHLDVANQSTVYYNTNGTAGLIGVSVVGNPSFHAAFIYVASNASVNAQAIGWSGNASGPRYLMEGNGVMDIGCTAPTSVPGSSAGVLRTGGQLLNGPVCVAPAPPDLHLSSTAHTVAAGERVTLAWRANSVAAAPTCWVHQSTGSGFFTAAPDTTTTITKGIAARGQKTSGPLTQTTTYTLLCLSTTGAVTYSTPVTVTVQ